MRGVFPCIVLVALFSLGRGMNTTTPVIPFGVVSIPPLALVPTSTSPDPGEVTGIAIVRRPDPAKEDKPIRNAAIILIGSETPTTQPGYVVKVVGAGGGHLCTGVLVGPNEVLVVAHCVASSISGGAPFPSVEGLRVREPVCRIEYSKKFRSSKCGDNSLAVLTLKNSFSFPSDPALSVDTASTKKWKSTGGEFVKYGWFGKCIGQCRLCDSPSQQLSVQKDMTIQSKNVCKSVLGKSFKSKTMLCANPPLSTICKWDLGQPLIHIDGRGRHTLVGMGVFGIQPSSGCNTATSFVRIDAHVKWIKDRKKSKTKVKKSNTC